MSELDITSGNIDIAVFTRQELIDRIIGSAGMDKVFAHFKTFGSS